MSIPKDLIKYKIHGGSTVRGVHRSSNTKVFYDSFEEAEERAKQCLREGATEIVIMKTVAVVRTTTPQFEVLTDDI